MVLQSREYKNKHCEQNQKLVVFLNGTEEELLPRVSPDQLALCHTSTADNILFVSTSDLFCMKSVSNN